MYKSGTLTLVVPCGHDDGPCKDRWLCRESEKERMRRDNRSALQTHTNVAYITYGAYGRDGNGWVIGGPSEIRALIADLEAAVLTLEGEMTPQERAIALILAERKAQDDQWGGPEHDDEHDTRLWARCIDKQSTRIRGRSFSETDRIYFEKIGALAVAAIESIERKKRKALEGE